MTGNVMYLHLFMDALALQPCNPTCTFRLCVTGFVNEEFFFAAVTARDAGIQADANRCKPKTYFIETHHSFNFVQIIKITPPLDIYRP